MNLFRPLFSDWKTAFYTIALGLVVATLFVARIRPELPLNTAAIILLAIAWIAEGQFKAKFKIFSQFWVWPPLILYILYIIGIAYSDNQELGWSVAERKLSFLLAPIIIAGSASFRKQHLGWSLLVFVISATLAMIVAYLLAIWNGTQITFEADWLDLLTYQYLALAIALQPIYLSLYLVFAFFALLALHLNSEFSGQWFYQNKARTYPLMAFLFVGIIMLSSRMEIMVLFATGVALVLFFSPSRAQRRKYALALLALALVAVAIIISSPENRQRFTEMVDIEADYTQNQYGGRSIRLHKWKNTLERWSQNPILGVGTGDMQTELNKTYAKNEFQLALDHEFNPHNQYLDTLLTIGIPGFLALTMWFWGMCWWGWQKRNWILFAFGLIVSLSVLSESMLERQWGIVFIAFFSVILMRHHFNYFRKSPDHIT